MCQDNRIICELLVNITQSGGFWVSTISVWVFTHQIIEPHPPFCVRLGPTVPLGLLLTVIDPISKLLREPPQPWLVVKISDLLSIYSFLFTLSVNCLPFIVYVSGASISFVVYARPWIFNPPLVDLCTRLSIQPRSSNFRGRMEKKHTQSGSSYSKSFFTVYIYYMITSF